MVCSVPRRSPVAFSHNDAGAHHARAASIAVSIVSHGHDVLLPTLLDEIAATSGGRVAQVLITHNLPAASIAMPSEGKFQLVQIHNHSPLGFGTNHNRAFRQCDAALFCVLNPDVSLRTATMWERLADACALPDTGCAYPTLRNPDGSRQDNARPTPSPWRLLRRRLLGLPESGRDWASAAFWLVPSPIFRELRGFDERYHMYCEDVDFCLRLQMAGKRLVHVDTEAIHVAQRQSQRTLRHLAWHVRSLLRLWQSDAYRRYHGLTAVGGKPPC